MRISDWSSDVCSSDLVVQAVDLGGVQFAEELVAAGAMPAFELAFALGGIGPAIDELNAQAHADTLQGLGTVGGAVIDDQFAAHAALEQGRSEEHTSELQSLMRISYAVFCLKQNTRQQNTRTRK